jgi:hypothetical protein
MFLNCLPVKWQWCAIPIFVIFRENEFKKPHAAEQL